MNFYQAQDDARKSTVRLVALFAAAVLALIVMTNLLVGFVYFWTSGRALGQPLTFTGLLAGVPRETWVLISIGVVGLVTVASLYKYLVLRGGGRAVAEALNGRLLTHDAASTQKAEALAIV